MNLIFGIFKKKLILKHFTRRTILKRCVLGVFWTAQYVSEVNLFYMKNAPSYTFNIFLRV